MSNESNFSFSNWLSEQRENFSHSPNSESKKQSAMGGLPSDFAMAMQNNPSQSSIQRGQKHWTSKPRSLRGNASKDEQEVHRLLDLEKSGRWNLGPKPNLVLHFEYAKSQNFHYVTELHHPDSGVKFFIAVKKGKERHNAYFCVRDKHFQYIPLWTSSSSQSISKALCFLFGSGQNPEDEYRRNDFLYHAGQWWMMWDLFAKITWTFPHTRNSMDLPKEYNLALHTPYQRKSQKFLSNYKEKTGHEYIGPEFFFWESDKIMLEKYELTRYGQKTHNFYNYNPSRISYSAL